jgi:hypothetical protein
MSIRFVAEVAGVEVTASDAGEDVTGTTASDRSGTWRGRLQGSSDFNPLMERVIRAQKQAEGRFYRTYNE